MSTKDSARTRDFTVDGIHYGWPGPSVTVQPMFQLKKEYHGRFDGAFLYGATEEVCWPCWWEGHKDFVWKSRCVLPHHSDQISPPSNG